MLKDTATIGSPLFVMVHDLSSKISKEKYWKIHEKLKSHLSCKPQIRNPEEAGLTEWKTFAPTIEIAFFTVSGISHEQLRDLVKEAVYVPSKNAKTGRFRIEAHGVIDEWR